MLTPRGALARLAARDQDGDAGFTMAEMLVTIVVLSVIGTMLSAWFIAGIDSTSKNTSRLNDENAVHAAAKQLAMDVQLAVPTPGSTTAGPFAAGTHDSISMYTNINGLSNPAYVVWSVTSSGGYKGALTRAYTPPVVGSTGTVTWPSTGTITKTELSGVYDISTGNVPVIFRFLDATNATSTQMCVDSSPAPNPCATPIASSTGSVDPGTTLIPNAVAVEIYLQAATAGDGVASTRGPYYETSKKSGVPYVYRTRVYPESNTVSN